MQKLSKVTPPGQRIKIEEFFFRLRSKVRSRVDLAVISQNVFPRNFIKLVQFSEQCSFGDDNLKIHEISGGQKTVTWTLQTNTGRKI